MKLKMISLAVALAVSSTAAVPAVSYADTRPTAKEEQRGFVAGALIGALAGGPVGAGFGGIVGGALVGKLMGYHRLSNELQDDLDHQVKTASSREQSLRAQLAALNTDLDTLLTESEGWDRRVLPIQFKTASSEIESHYAAQLDQVCQVLSRNIDTRVVLAGYADRRGDEAFNQALSEQRVAQVRAYLLSRGVKPRQVISQAFGESQPLVREESAESNFFDRRVVMAFELDIDSKLATR